MDPHLDKLGRHAEGERTVSASTYLQILGRFALRASLESTAPGATEAAEMVRPRIREMLDRLQRCFEAGDRGLDAPDAETLRLRAQVLTDAERALDTATRDPTGTRLDRRNIFAFEALIRPQGRPALVVRDGTYNPEDPEMTDEWAEILALAGERISEVVRSVGRIDLGGSHVGSGFVVAPGLVLTNRHVLEALAVDPRGRDSWTFKDRVEIDFKAELGRTARLAFHITGVAFADAELIGETVDLRKLDLALLTVEEHNAENAPLPPQLPLVGNSGVAQGRRELALVGYPAQPRRLPHAADGRIDPEVLAALERIFRFQYGVKRLALGRIDRRLGTLAGDVRSWALGHDATTLGGNSGSAAVVFEGDDDGHLPVLALHMGGQWLLQNYAHVLAAVPQLRGSPPISQAALMDWR